MKTRACHMRLGCSADYNQRGAGAAGSATTRRQRHVCYRIMGALVEFERDLIRERTWARMTAAKKFGKYVGRPKALSSGQVQHMRELLTAVKTKGSRARLLLGGLSRCGSAIWE